MVTLKTEKKSQVLILIPARFGSNRFPGKPLAQILGKSMVRWVLENTSSISHPHIDFYSCVVTDHPEIEKEILQFSALLPNNFIPPVVRVDDDVVSGTLRIELAFRRYFKSKNFDLIVNVQGDEPLLTQKEVVALSEFHLSHFSKFEMGTLIKKEWGLHGDFLNPNKVKVVVSEKNGTALYFSRAPIPFKRDHEAASDDYWFLHIGVYSYRPEALSALSRLEISRLEDLEKLEQLRALDNGMKIGVVETDRILVGVDAPDDLKRVEEILIKRVQI